MIAPPVPAAPSWTEPELIRFCISANDRLRTPAPPVLSTKSTPLVVVVGCNTIPPFPVMVMRLAVLRVMLSAERVTIPVPASIAAVFIKVPPAALANVMLLLPEDSAELTVSPVASVSDTLICPDVIPERLAIDVVKGAAAVPTCPALVITKDPVVPMVRSVVAAPGLNRLPVPIFTVMVPPFFSVSVLAPVKLKFTELPVPSKARL